ncbi:MAG: hypothetical protein ACE5HT_16360 [Gemmatimonadales bacterium]
MIEQYQDPLVAPHVRQCLDISAVEFYYGKASPLSELIDLKTKTSDRI